MHFLLLPNPRKAEAMAFSSSLNEWLISRSQAVFTLDDYGFPGAVLSSPSSLPDDTVVIVMGGDGTLLYAVRQLGRLDLPFLLINFGHVGFLAQCFPENAFDMLSRLLAGERRVLSRALIRVTLRHPDGTCDSALALNEVMVNRGSCNRAISVSMKINGNTMPAFSADGILIATPTGSTAYNMVNGGPVISPDCDVLTVKPVASRLWGCNSLVLQGDQRLFLQVRMPYGISYQPDACPFLLADSTEKYPVSDQDIIEISRAEETFKTVLLDDGSFLTALYRRLSKPE